MIPNINAIPDLTLLTTKLLEFIEFEEKEETQKLKEEDRGNYNYIVYKEYEMLPPTMIKLLSEKEKRTENLQKVLDMLELLKNVKNGTTDFEKAENDFMEKRSEEYLYPMFGGRDKFYQIAEENKKKKEKTRKK
jgi:uncharacterized protein YdiU (UPF0061 family)